MLSFFVSCAMLFCNEQMHAGDVVAVESEVPVLLQGLWQNESRVVSFEHTAATDIVLKVFYGWYYDRAAEPSSGVPPRPRNDATSQIAETVSVSFEPIIPASNESGAWNVSLYYPSFGETVVVPVAVFGGNLYIDFMLVSDDSSQRFFQAASNASGITVNLPSVSYNVYSFYDTGSALYKIRYWQTGMDFEQDSLAEFIDDDGTHSVPKHLDIGGTTYTCVPGRGIAIRNIEKIPYDKDSFLISPDGRICVEEDAYLSLLTADSNQLYSEVEVANSRRRPPRPPLLPPPDVDFHYDEISELRKYAVVPIP